MPVQWRLQFKCHWLFRKVPHPMQNPYSAVVISDLQLIPGNVERRIFPTIRRFDFNQALVPFRGKAFNIIAGTITFGLTDPLHLFGQILASVLGKDRFLMTKNTSLPLYSKLSISLIPRGDIKLAGETLGRFQIFGRFRVL